VVDLRGSRRLAVKSSVPVPTSCSDSSFGDPLHGLPLNKAKVDALELHELIVGASLDNHALIKDTDDVGVLDRGKAVSNNDGSPATRGGIVRLLHQLLALSVQGRRGLVQQQDLGGP